jgi:malate dehydrogenase
MRFRVAVIGGGGNVGASVGLYLSESNLADVVLLDILEGVPQGKALDLSQAAALRGSNARLTGSSSLDDVRGSDLVVVTAGFPRQPGMSRSDLLKSNADIVRAAAEAVRRHAPDAILVVVTNPLDVMAYLAYRTTGFPKRQVVGMAGVLDAARFRAFVAGALDVAAADVQAMVLGGHGDSMVPLARYTTVGGVPITELLAADEIARLSERTRGGGAEIVGLLKTGSAFYAPAASVVEMARSILLDEKRVLPCSVLLEGEYGLSDVFLGVPCVLGRTGVERVLELALSVEERKALAASAAAVAKDVAELELPVA